MKNVKGIGFIVLLLLGLLATGMNCCLYAYDPEPIKLEVFPNPVVEDNFRLTSDVEITGIIRQIFGRDRFIYLF